MVLSLFNRAINVCTISKVLAGDISNFHWSFLTRSNKPAIKPIIENLHFGEAFVYCSD